MLAVREIFAPVALEGHPLGANAIRLGCTVLIVSCYPCLLCLERTTLDDFGERLRILRNRKDTSYKDLPMKRGRVTAAHLSDIEFGRRHLPNALLAKLASFFNVDWTTSASSIRGYR